ncbi:MAG: EAL domain-containing protein, partial [Xanthomonadaceae bacterium]|nr:EAL domain-containing protein [Xanthomonadaceae bacterium]
TLCIMDRAPRELVENDRETLRVLAQQVMAQLDLRRQYRLLAASSRESRSSRKLLAALSHNVPGVIYQYRLYPDGHSSFPFASEGMWSIYEVTPEQVAEDASIVFSRLHPDDLDVVSAEIRESAQNLTPWQQDFRVVLPLQGERWRRGNAQPEWLEDGSVLWHGFITDVTDYKRVEQRVHQLAYFDTLTGLPNRVVVMNRLEDQLAQAARTDACGALLFVDLDNFKQVNDARGHRIGDRILLEVAARLASGAGPEECVARVGGDEFVVLMAAQAADREDAARRAMLRAEEIRQRLSGRMDVEGQRYKVTASIGIAVYPCGRDGIDDVIREADTAMYRAKRNGPNEIAFFEPHMQQEVAERLELEQELEEALRSGQLQLHVQPQRSLRSGLVGAEVLVRWKHPVRGMIPPSQFIPIAEDSGQIIRLGEFVLRGACLVLAQLQQVGVPCSLSVNVSPAQFLDPRFVRQVRQALEESGARGDGLVLEVTEGLLIRDLESTIRRMKELTSRGVRFSVDDFGTGYSNLGYLQALPLHELKVDKRFVAGIGRSAGDEAIVRTIISMARLLSLHLVAEGVETEAQASFLDLEGCEVIQGYLVSHPQPIQSWLHALLNPSKASA